MIYSTRILLGGALLACSLVGLAQTPTPTPTATTQSRNDYSQPQTWLCRPGRQDACTVDIATTIVNANGKLQPEPFKANANAPIDCFYVYPTVSRDTTANSDMTAGPEETGVIRQQFARFAAQCRTFAPLYRQISMGALRGAMSGQAMGGDRELAYNDVLDAWKHYLEHDNQGRGVVLVGHSQGSSMLTRLIANELDGKPMQSKLISALLLGTNVAVPKGKDVGGAFKNVPLCRDRNQLGCALAYVSFRADVPPPANSRFGKVAGEGMQAACVNPAALRGGSAQLHAYLSSNGGNGNVPEARQWVKPQRSIDTPFVSVPGLLSGECIADERGSYLAVKVNADPQDARADDIAGDVSMGGRIAADWGLHLVDANLAMGDLISLVAAQSKAYLQKN